MLDKVGDDTRTQALRQMTRIALEAGRTGTAVLDDSVTSIPATDYTDPERYRAELKQIFGRLPLLLAVSAELPNPGDFKTIEAGGRNVLLTRQSNGSVRAFLNICSHRGMKVASEPSGNASRHVCPYHGWTYGADGRLIGIAAPGDFGEVDKACLSLTELPCAERAGLVWATLDPKSRLDIPAFLSGYDDLLGVFDFEHWHVVGHETITGGSNWKASYDGYLDFYHVAILHKDTIGKGLGNRAIYFPSGPHQRVLAPMSRHADYDGVPESEWPVELLTDGVWTIFPHVSIAPFAVPSLGGRMVMISALFPGTSVDSSRTEQIFLFEREPTEEDKATISKMQKMLRYVVEVEDYGAVRTIHQALSAGGIERVLFGRNEGGSRRFHEWVDRLIAMDDTELIECFEKAEAC